MAGNATIGVDLGGVITTSGGLNSQVLQALADYIMAQGYTFEPAPKSAFPLPEGIFGTLTGDPVVALDSSSAGLNTAGFNATITGGGPSTAIIAPGGDLEYSGGAGHVFANLGTGTIDSSAAAASITAIDGTYEVIGTGADSYVLGGGGAVTAFSSGASSATLEGGVTYVSGVSDTITATAGTSTIFGESNNLYTGYDATVLFVGLGTGSTVLGGAGADTVYGDGTTFMAGTGAKVFAGSTASSVASFASTVYAGQGSATIQTGAHGDLVFLQGSADRVVSGGGRDTIWGQAGGIAPTIFGTTNSYEMMVSNMKGGLAIGMGDNTTLDGANTSGGLTYFANPGLGNQTFIGSAFGNDSFYIGSQDVGTSLITIADWHFGDTLNMTAFGAADQATIAKTFASGGNLFKLSDGTTVVFSGSHPTSGSHSFYK